VRIRVYWHATKVADCFLRPLLLPKAEEETTADFLTRVFFSAEAGALTAGLGVGGLGQEVCSSLN
jgi:hypothetical protein